MKVLAAVHGLAVQRLTAQRVGAVPGSAVVFVPAVVVAALTGYSERHTYRLAAELKAAGCLDSRGYVADVGKLRRYAGTLWAVKLKPDAPAPRLRWHDFRHDWRADFAEDYHGETGAFHDVLAACQNHSTCEDRIGRLREIALAFAVGSYTAKSRRCGGSDTRGLRGVADRLGGLIGMHPRHRHREVGQLAGEIAASLNEPGRFKQWCGAVYAALDAENELRPGLEPLALQLRRLAADLADGAPWHRPGAVLAARLAPTS